jgi:hypothetical protein
MQKWIMPIMFSTLMAQALKVKQNYSTCKVDTNTKTKQNKVPAHLTVLTTYNIEIASPSMSQEKEVPLGADVDELPSPGGGDGEQGEAQ